MCDAFSSHKNLGKKNAHTFPIQGRAVDVFIRVQSVTARKPCCPLAIA